MLEFLVAGIIGPIIFLPLAWLLRYVHFGMLIAWIITSAIMIFLSIILWVLGINLNMLW